MRIDGNARRVVTAEWVSLQPSGDAPPPVPAPPDGFSTNEGSTGGRLIVLAIDQPNIRFGGALAIAKAANAFIDRLMPSDRVAVAGIGVGAPATVFTADRARIKQAISRMAGQKQLESGSTNTRFRCRRPSRSTAPTNGCCRTSRRGSVSTPVVARSCARPK